MKDESKQKVREYKTARGEIIRMTEEEFQQLVEYFLVLKKAGKPKSPTQSQKNSEQEELRHGTSIAP
jgi:uncharacterized coiled-coil DUF342 family protein